MTTTEKPRPRKLPKLDLSRIEAEENAYVAKTLRGIRRADRRLKESTQIAAAAEEMSDLTSPVRQQRDAAALSLSLYEHVKAVHAVVGVSRAYFHEMRCRALGLTAAERGTWLKNATPEQIAERASAKGVPELDPVKAEQWALAAGERVARAEKRASYARIIRDQAVVELTRDGWSRRQIADVAGFDDSRVSQILSDAR